jgi:hypothetical protein
MRIFLFIYSNYVLILSEDKSSIYRSLFLLISACGPYFIATHSPGFHTQHLHLVDFGLEQADVHTCYLLPSIDC